MQFPTVSGHNLERKKQTFPADFEGQYNLILIAFQQWQQMTVNTWLPHARQLCEQNPDFSYYEFPVIESMPLIGRLFINEGMRAGIADQTARERTITLYLDKRAFRDALQIPTEQEITVLLVDRSGQVLSRAQGPYSPEKSAALLATVLEPATA